MKKTSMLGICCAAVMLSASTYAGDATVDFDAGEDGSFFCTATSAITLIGGKVSIDTRSVKAHGFCDGQPYVSSKGHIRDLSARDLNKYFFSVKSDGKKGGSINIYGNVDLTCAKGSGENRSEYGSGGYC